MPRTRASPFYGALLSGLLFFGLGTHWIVTGEANFTLGGDENKSAAQDRRAIQVHSTNREALAMGVGAYGLGFVVIAQGMRTRRAIPVLILGGALLLVGVLWKIGIAVGLLSSS